MPRYSKKNNISEQTRDEAQKIARGTQKPGQTKEQTKLISQGIQKGIDLYKKQQKAKARELDKKLKQVSQQDHKVDNTSTQKGAQPERVKAGKLPWVLLLLSWLGFVLYVTFNHVD